MAKYQTIFFDLDDTLIDFKRSEVASLALCYEQFFKNNVDRKTFYSDYTRINLSLWELVEQNQIPSSGVRKERFCQLLALYKMPQEMNIATFYEDLLVEHCAWIEGAPELLQHLQAHHIQIGFISNGFSDLQRKKCEKLQAGRYSKTLIISEEIGISKPHPEIFLYALARIQGEIATSLMVGDSLFSDGAGARNVGMDFCWYNPERLEKQLDFEPHLIIHNLVEPILTFT